MDIEELEPRKQKPKLKDLSVFSVEELKEYISVLENEIARAQEAIKGKEAHRQTAAGFFKS
jgi:uncharacterized small protein (DUF1192 family)